MVRYLQLAHNERTASGQVVARVIHSLGREDQADREALQRLVRSISRFLAAVISAVSCGGPSLRPETATSQYSWSTSRPRRAAYPRSPRFLLRGRDPQLEGGADPCR